MKTSINIILSSVAFTLSGCIPYPHTSTRFQGVSGHVLDARTHHPITGVRVAVHAHPSTRTTTDASGAFRISAQRNFHILLIPGPCSSSIPEGHYWSPSLDFSSPGYRPLSFDTYQHANPTHRDNGELVRTEVLLEPAIKPMR